MRQHGQALVEATLGMLMFIGILVMAMHVHEIGQMSLKVQEAATHELWDVTGRSVRGPNNEVPRFTDGDSRSNTGDVQNMLKTVKQETDDRYQDFDGRTGTPGGAMMFTKGLAMGVGAKMDYAQMDPPYYCQVRWVKNADVLDNGVKVIVQASGSLTATGLATKMEDMTQKGVLPGKNGGTGSAAREVKVCGVGKMVGTDCKAGLWVVPDDWSVRDAEECEVQKGEACTNKEYYDAVKPVFQHSLGNANEASQFAKDVVGVQPYSEQAFWMSARDQRSGFKENAPPPGEGELRWKTGYGPASRANCFLGRFCNR